MREKQRILITKFPFRSRLSGVEKHTFQIVDKFNGKEVDFFLISSCPIMLSEFTKRGWHAQKWWLGWPPVNLFTKIVFYLIYPLQIISVIISLAYYKLRYKINKLYCLTLTEKLVMTPFARLFGYKVLWFEHLSITPVISKNFYRHFYWLWSHFVKVVVISEYVNRELKQIGVKNAQVIYHGIDPEKFKRQKDIFEAMVDKRFSFNKGEEKKFRIGCVSRLENLRGIEYLIKAVVPLKKEFDNIEIVIVGEGSERDRLQWLIKQLELSKYVRLVGYKDNFIEWVEGFDVFVLPSLKESLGLVLIEALACKIPVVATRVGGIPEIVQDGVHGILVEPQNTKALAGAVYSLIMDRKLARKLATAGSEKIMNEFHIDKMYYEYRTVLMS